jgi:hypothetical protein
MIKITILAAAVFVASCGAALAVKKHQVTPAEPPASTTQTLEKMGIACAPEEVGAQAFASQGFHPLFQGASPNGGQYVYWVNEKGDQGIISSVTDGKICALAPLAAVEYNKETVRHVFHKFFGLET